MKPLSLLPFTLLLILTSCAREAVAPEVVTERTPYDTDDPAIWVHPDDPSRSLVFGTDKATDGGVYAFNLQGKIVDSMSLTGVKRPNNVDVEYGWTGPDGRETDLLVFTEREASRVRVYSLPDLLPLDSGGFPVFADASDERFRLPMGIACYRSPRDGSVYLVVGRKYGPKEGYLYQYRLSHSDGMVRLEPVRRFGRFSGIKEIEAIAVDDAAERIYYSDEGQGIRVYAAEPSDGDEELAVFGARYFKDDIEGIALSEKGGTDGGGTLIVSDQQGGRFNIFDKTGFGYLGSVDLGTRETDGCDVYDGPLGDAFPNGIFVSMSDDRTFRFHDRAKVRPQETRD